MRFSDANASPRCKPVGLTSGGDPHNKSCCYLYNVNSQLVQRNFRDLPRKQLLPSPEANARQRLFITTDQSSMSLFSVPANVSEDALLTSRRGVAAVS